MIEKDLKIDPDYGTFTGQYGRDGLVDAGLYDWTELPVFYTEPTLPPPWGERYLFEICSFIVDRPRLTGDHTFVRLKTPRGEWYSAGQYRPHKMGFHEQFVFPMKIKPSKFQSPDVSEYWKGNVTVLSVGITADQFLAIKKQLEYDQAHGEHTYQVLLYNHVYKLSNDRFSMEIAHDMRNL